MRGNVETPIQGAQTCDLETKPELQVQASTNTVATELAHHGGRYVMVGQVLIMSSDTRAITVASGQQQSQTHLAPVAHQPCQPETRPSLTRHQSCGRTTRHIRMAAHILHRRQVCTHDAEYPWSQLESPTTGWCWPESQTFHPRCRVCSSTGHSTRSAAQWLASRCRGPHHAKGEERGCSEPATNSCWSAETTYASASSPFWFSCC